MREGIEGVGKWKNMWARGEYASLTLGGMDAPVCLSVVCNVGAPYLGG